MIEGITPKSKIKIHWKTSPYDYSLEKVNSLIAKASKKYGLPKDNIKVIPEFVVLNEEGQTISMTDTVIKNIQDPSFQQKLFIDYVNLHEIKDVDFDIINSLDNEINSKIDYDVYDKYRNFSIKWVKWSNFLSYGKDNFFDFTTLKDIVLLSGEPANQSGKTTFAIDLIHFLLYGKTAKATTQDKIFNKFLEEETEVVVEGCISIEGDDYVIKRRLTRPSFSKRTSKSKTTQKIEYYKIVGDTLEELDDYVENYEGESTQNTNKIIKESIGKEEDFDMIMCATSSNLDDLIEKKETERGKLLSRWIGLLPLEQKDILARERYNSQVKPYLLSNRYNTEQIHQDNITLQANIDAIGDIIVKSSKELDEIDKTIGIIEDTKNVLLSQKTTIDESLLKIDKTTLFNNIEKAKVDGINKKKELAVEEENFKEYENIEFEPTQFDELMQSISQLETKQAILKERCRNLKNTIATLEKSEYCPTCGRKYDNIDNSSKIKELQDELNPLMEEGMSNAQTLTELQNKLVQAKILRDKFNEKSKIILKINTLKFDLLSLREKYKELINTQKEYERNNEAIDKNNEIELKLRNLDVELKGKRSTKETTIAYIERQKSQIDLYKKNIDDNIILIGKLQEEEQIVRHWKIYLELIGKNGISKMVLRKTLPIINAQMSQLLLDVCDFDVEIQLNDKNEVLFYLVKDGVYSDLTSGSGFEKTAAALVLRVVLGNISNLPKLDGIILDELWGRVAKENLDNMHKILEKILVNYKYIIQISHLDEVKDWSQQHIVVKKKDNVSYLEKQK